MINISLAMEAPNQLLKDLPYITDFDWVLTHLCEDSNEYLAHYQNIVAQTNREVILDNSVNELGEPLGLGRMDEVVVQLNPDYIVPPDYLNNLEATLGILDEAIDLWGKNRILPVLQGTSIKEVLECADILANKYEFKIVSVPYDVTLAHRSKLPSDDFNRAELEELAETRIKIMSALVKNGITFNRYHLLGMNTLEEFRSYRKQSFWMSTKAWGGFYPEISVDTGAPITNALNGIQFGKGHLIPKGVYFDYYNERYKDSEYRDWYWNICVLRGSLND